MKILVPVDGSPYTRKMLAWLGAHDWLTAEAGHALTLLHAVTPLPHNAAALAGPDIVRSYIDDDAETVFRPVRAFLSEHGVKATYEHHVGHAGEMIARFADEGKYDLVVLGSHGHGALAGLVLGSVATQVLARCKVPVLVIR